MADLQLVWFRNDLRTDDHLALADAAASGPVVAVYCFCPEQFRMHDVGGNRVAFTLAHLGALSRALDALGIPLRILETGTFAAVPDALAGLAAELGARGLWFNDEYPLHEARRDAAVEQHFGALGIPVHRRTDAVVQAPGTVRTGSGGAYTVFTPFRRRWQALFDPVAARPRARPAVQVRPPVATDDPPHPSPDLVATADLSTWPVGETAARARLEDFLGARIRRYDADRDVPGLDGTSALSPYLSLGVLSVRRCLEGALAVNEGRLDGGDAGIETWISELVWREFYRHVVAAFPHVSRGHAFRREYDDFPWRDDGEALAAWEAGRTGFPLVDAAMRQLVATGWMHNRLRMVTAMFLSKNLLLDWHAGERFFMRHLLDGDFAANNGGWQWSASTGTDAAPYFRVFSPISQSERFDADGAFIRRWLPELAGVPLRALHDPSRRGPVEGYPEPIVDAKASRARAIESFRSFAGA
jgi:deoxyribodipyrimidine photo-lyase